MSSSSKRKIGALVLFAVLLAPWTAVADPVGRSLAPSVQGSGDLLATFWNAITALWGDNGCSMDPFGLCRDDNDEPEPAENGEAGCSVDPFGGGCREGS